MKMVVCSVRDRGVDSYGAPFFVRSVAEATRLVSDQASQKGEGNLWNLHPEDFELYVLGSFDSETALFECGVPRQLALVKDLVR